MEIPTDLKNLYQHWKFYQVLKSITKFNGHKESITQIEYFIKERMLIWEKKVSKQNPPYTTDPILANYRFCNIYRELDRQTIEIHTRLNPLKIDFELWLLNLAFMRFIAKTETIEKIGLLSFNKVNNQKVFERLKALPKPKYGTAYIFPISVIMKTKYPTREEFFCFYLPEATRKVANEVSKFNRISIVDALNQILPVFGFNMKFHWTEILIDVAYQFPEFIDLNKKFPIGPGSLPTMKILFPDLDPEEACLKVSSYQPSGFPYLTLNGKKVYLTAENWEGIGCEFRKYSNLKTGNGRKRIYRDPNQS
ncbi:hypothetical protein KC660_03825 [Candidatus Dojkabacteria bacterium]|uniref:5-hmdU DNA kinase helical domain-containing protein n=1 Tax=Candidatus Dojkabacteria bacterium TaxID=2099670 RepID=A0A955L456_9BACT|nr:hypothetical protein [Candidatus Dojkabacteria bacterium]